MKDVSQFENLIMKGKNKLPVTCQYCNSRILNEGTAEHAFLEHNLPLMTLKKDAPAQDSTENVYEFWIVDDMYTFENIGFTHTVDDIKYLSCADCEMGPVGYHIISTKKSYVALSRVKHV